MRKACGFVQRAHERGIGMLEQRMGDRKRFEALEPTMGHRGQRGRQPVGIVWSTG
jgi:hypothetical protein